jgi:hypothetical protein
MPKCEGCGEGFSGSGHFCDDCKMEQEITKSQDEMWAPPPAIVSGRHDSLEENQRRLEFFPHLYNPALGPISSDWFIAEERKRQEDERVRMPKTVLEFGEPQSMGMSNIYGLWVWRVPDFEDLTTSDSIPRENWKLVESRSGQYNEIPKYRELQKQGLLPHGEGRYVVAIGKGNNFEWKELNKGRR